MMILNNFDFQDRMSRLRRFQPVEQMRGFSTEKTTGIQFSISTSAEKIVSTLATLMNSRLIHDRRRDRQYQSRRLTKGSLIVALLTTLMMTMSTQPIPSIAHPRVAESIEARTKHRRRLTKHRTSSHFFNSPPEIMKRNIDATNSTIATKNISSSPAPTSSNSTTSNISTPEYIRHESNCYTPLIQSQDDTDVISTAYGIVFAIQNNNNQTSGGSNAVTFDTMSVHLDGSQSANFTLYSLDGMYLSENHVQDESVDDLFIAQENSVVETTSYLGQNLNGVPGGWRLLAEGLSDKYSNDEDGMTILPVSSFLDDGGIKIDAGTVKSFYLNFSALVLVVGNVPEDQDLGESVDESVEISDGASGLEVLVGRGVIFDDWPSTEGDAGFVDFLYPPNRFVGKVWSGLDNCAPTATPTTAPPSAKPSESPSGTPSSSPISPTDSPTASPTRFESVTVKSIEMDIFLFDRRLLNPRNKNIRSREVQDACVDEAEAYPILRQSIEDHSWNIYTNYTFGTVVLLTLDVTIKSNEDISVDGNCQKIRFQYDEEIKFTVVGSDETTVSEVVEYPFSTEEFRGMFVTALILVDSNISGGDESSGLFSNASNISQWTLPLQGLSTRMPTSTPSMSALPSYTPSIPPTDFPSIVPTATSRPSTSVSPSFEPSTSPSISIKPSASHAPSTAPSVQPTISFQPSEVPTLFPSTFPSTSTGPSSGPTGFPSAHPSLLPSTFPTIAPTTYYSEVVVMLQFDVSFSPNVGYRIEKDIISNVTRSFEDLLTINDGNELYPLVNIYEISLSTNNPPQVEEVAASDAYCPEKKDDNKCGRFLIRISFEHNRRITDNGLKFWILEEADEIASDLSASYTGNRTVASFLIMIFENTSGKPTSEEEEIICYAIRDAIAESSSYLNVTVLGVVCKQFVFIEDPPSRLLRRELQNNIKGTLNVTYEVTGEYRPIPGKEDAMEEDFGILLEDSINAGNGEKVLKAIEKRDLALFKEAVVESREMARPESTPPSRAPLGPAPVIVEGTSPESDYNDFASRPAGIAVIVSCSIVLISVGFLFYQGLRKLNLENDVQWEKEKNRTDEKFDPSVFVQGQLSYENEEQNNRIFTPGYYNSGETSNFRDNLIDLYTASAMHAVVNDEVLVPIDDKEVSDNLLRPESQRRLAAFEARLQQQSQTQLRSESQRRLDIFELRMTENQNQVNINEEVRVNNHSASVLAKKQEPVSASNDDKGGFVKSTSSRDSFQGSRMKKMSIGTSRGRNVSTVTGTSQKRLDDFNVKLQKKRDMVEGCYPGSEVDSKNEGVSEKSSTFDERYRKKAEEGKLHGRIEHITSQEKEVTLKNSEENKTPPHVLSNSKARLADFEDRLKQKQFQADSFDMSSPQIDQSKLLPQKISLLKDFEQRLKHKQEQKDGLPRSIEDRIKLKQVHSASESTPSFETYKDRIIRKQAQIYSNDAQSTSSMTRVERNNSEAMLLKFENKIRRKHAGADESYWPRQDFSHSQSMTSLENFEDRIKRKQAQSYYKSKGSSSSSRIVEHKDSKTLLLDFENKISRKQAKADSSNESRRDFSHSKSTMLPESFENLIKRKHKQIVTESKTSLQTFEDRVNRKEAQSESKPTPSSSSLRIAERDDSKILFEKFENKISRKQVEAIASNRSCQVDSNSESKMNLKSSDDRINLNQIQSVSESIPSLENLEDRMKWKQALSDSKPTQSSSSSQKAERSDSKAMLLRFENKIRRTKAGADESNWQRQDFAHSESMTSQESFEDRIKRKQTQFDCQATASSSSPGRVESNNSEAMLLDFENKMEQKQVKAGSRQDLFNSKSSVLPESFESLIKRKQTQFVSESKTSLQTFEDRLKQKQAQSESKPT